MGVARRWRCHKVVRGQKALLDRTRRWIASTFSSLFELGPGQRRSSRRLAAVGPKEVIPAAQSDGDAVYCRVMP